MTLPDTGARSQFETGAVRDACSGKGLPSRIPPEAIRRLAKRYEDGEAKYPDADGVPNWMRGIPLSRYFDSAMRHLLAAAEGDTSEDHLGAVLWNAAGWIWTADALASGRLPGTLDDLPFARATDRTGGTEWWDPKHDTVVEPAPPYLHAKIRFSNGTEFDAPSLPEGYDSYRALPYGEGPQEGTETAFFWDEDGEPMPDWVTPSPYPSGPDVSTLYWIVAEKSVKPGDRVRVTDSDGPGEPYEFEAEVAAVTSDKAVRPVISSVWYRKDQITLLP